MPILRKTAVVLSVFAVSMLITACLDHICLRPNSPAWLTGIYTTCVMLGSLVGGIVGAVIGYSIHAIVYRKLGPQYCSIISLLLAPIPSALLGAVLALIVVGQMWPPEMVYGHDPDHLVGYGFIAGAVTALVFASGIASKQPHTQHIKS